MVQLAVDPGTHRGYSPRTRTISGFWDPIMENQMEKNMENEMETGIM